MAFIDISLHVSTHQDELEVSLNTGNEGRTCWVDLKQFRVYGNDPDCRAQVGEFTFFFDSYAEGRTIVDAFVAVGIKESADSFHLPEPVES